MPKGTITLLGYRWSCGRCSFTEEFTPQLDEQGDIVVSAVDIADQAGWRETERWGWLCPADARRVRMLRHTFEVADGQKAG